MTGFTYLCQSPLSRFKIQHMFFSDIPGQEAVKEKLLQSVANQRISHTQLFLGPEGAGGLALAIAYARYVHCQNRAHGDACGTCPSCVKYRKLVHPDLHFIYPVARLKKEDKEPLSSDFITVWRKTVLQQSGIFSFQEWTQSAGFEDKKAQIFTKECDEINRRLSYKSLEGEYKIMIIWLIEKIYHSAAHKLLKVLEEPPDKTLFILVSENQELILPTILSRTQLVKIKRFTDRDIRESLVSRQNLGGEHAAQLALLAEGNLITARQMAAESESFFNYFATFRDWMRYCYKYNYNPNPAETRNTPIITEIIPAFEKLGPERQKQFLLFGLRLLRSCLLVKLKGHEVVNLTGEELDFAEKFSAFVGPDNIGRYNEAIQNAIVALERNGKPPLVFTALTIKFNYILRDRQQQKTK